MRKFTGRIQELLRFAGSSLLELCFPKICAGCGKINVQDAGFWCRRCRRELPHIRSPLCPRCGRPFPDAPESPDHLCSECMESVFHFDTARSAVLHSGIVRDRIHQYKFGGKLHWLPAFVELCEAVYACWRIAPPDMIMPVPLHLKRLQERGFNQSGLLAKELGRRLDVRVSFDSLIRKVRTQPQTRLDREDRLQNVRGAFEVQEASEVRNRRILIVDDVFTTGETLSECARTLKKAGADEVHALTITRALPRN